jgi:hypothetical protein
MWRPLPVVFFDLGGFGVELSGHQAQSLRAGEIKAGARNAEAVFGLVTQELRCQHDRGFRLLGFERFEAEPAQCFKCKDEMLVPGWAPD